MKKERLTIEDRMLIENLLKENYKLKDIARVIEVQPSTISREIKGRRKSNRLTLACEKTIRFPFVCQGCSKKTCCHKRKYYYNFREAQKDYENKLKYSRIGIDMTIDEVEYWNDFFKDRIKNKNQPIMHIFHEIEEEFPKSIQTFYKYVHKGYFPSINDEMLSRSFAYKKRERKETVKTISSNNSIKVGRRYSDYLEYIKKHPNANVVEMDTVIGKFEDVKCIMTLFFKSEKLMLMFLINKYKPSEITKVFNYLKKKLGNDTFKSMFEVILTDNGWEFSLPVEIEIDTETGEKLVSLFYTESYSSWQKGSIERNHEFIRYVLQKGISFDTLTKKNVNDIMNNINNVQRKSLNYQTPSSLFKNKYGEDVYKALSLRDIPKEDVNLSYKILKK